MAGFSQHDSSQRAAYVIYHASCVWDLLLKQHRDSQLDAEGNFSPEELTVVIFYIPSLSNLILKLLLNISTISEVQFSVFIWILVGLQLSIVSTVD